MPQPQMPQPQMQPRIQPGAQPMAPQQAQPQMTTPPRVITTKDASYLKDQMSWLLVAAKKCAHYAKECTDPQVRQAIDRIGQMHQRHYQLLLGHLKTNNSQAMQSVPQPGQTAH